MEKITTAKVMAKIESINSMSDLRRIQKILRARMFDVRYADAPKEKAVLLRARKLRASR